MLVGAVVLVAVAPLEQEAPSSVMRSPQPFTVPVSYWPLSLTTSFHVPCACCPTSTDRSPSLGKYVALPGGQVVPTIAVPVCETVKPVFALVHEPLPHTWANSVTWVPAGLTR